MLELNRPQDVRLPNPLALTVAYIPYTAVEVPASLVLKCVGANILLPTMAILYNVP